MCLKVRKKQTKNKKRIMWNNLADKSNAAPKKQQQNKIKKQNKTKQNSHTQIIINNVCALWIFSIQPKVLFL